MDDGMFRTTTQLLTLLPIMRGGADGIERPCRFLAALHSKCISKTSLKRFSRLVSLSYPLSPTCSNGSRTPISNST
jgi:hypothetical protein